MEQVGNKGNGDGLYMELTFQGQTDPSGDTSFGEK